MKKIGNTTFILKQEDLMTLNNEHVTYKQAEMFYPNVDFRFDLFVQGVTFPIDISMKQQIFTQSNKIEVDISEVIPVEFTGSNQKKLLNEVQGVILTLLSNFQKIIYEKIASTKFRLLTVTQALFEPVIDDYSFSINYLLDHSDAFLKQLREQRKKLDKKIG